MTANGASLSVYLHTKGFVALAGGRVLHAHEGQDTAANVRDLHRWLSGGSAGSKGTVYLSGALCRPFLARIPDGLTEQESERAWTAAATTRTGVSADCRIWRDANGKTAPESRAKQLAVAVENSLLSQLLQVPNSNRPSKTTRSRVVSVQPAWAEWLRVGLEQKPKSSCLVLHETDSVTVLAGQGGEFEVASTVLRTTDAALTQTAVDRLLLVAAATEEPPHMARLHDKAMQAPTRTASSLAGILETLA